MAFIVVACPALCLEAFQIKLALKNIQLYNYKHDNPKQMIAKLSAQKCKIHIMLTLTSHELQYQMN